MRGKWQQEMMKQKGITKMNIKTLTMIMTAALALLSGCSQEDREEAADRIGKAADALKGDGGSERTPRIVKEQQRKERIRQNTKWTPENQAKFPIEYCQAMLEEIDKDSQHYEVLMHKFLTAKSSVTRGISENDAQLKSYGAFLATAKKSYREADASGTWPVTINGFALTKEKLQEKIVDAANKIKSLELNTTTQKTNLTKLEKKVARITEEQRKLVLTKESLKRTLDNLQLKTVVDSDDGIKDSVAAINDALGALGDGAGDISLEDLVTPDADTVRKTAFDAIMAE